MQRLAYYPDTVANISKYTVSVIKIKVSTHRDTNLFHAEYIKTHRSEISHNFENSELYRYFNGSCPEMWILSILPNGLEKYKKLCDEHNFKYEVNENLPFTFIKIFIRPLGE